MLCEAHLLPLSGFLQSASSSVKEQAEITTQIKNIVFISFYCLLSATYLFLSVWGLTPLLVRYASGEKV